MFCWDAVKSCTDTQYATLYADNNISIANNLILNDRVKIPFFLFLKRTTKTSMFLWSTLILTKTSAFPGALPTPAPRRRCSPEEGWCTIPNTRRPAVPIPPLHGTPQLLCLPEGFPLHVLICDAVVHQGLIPHGVTGVAQSLRPQLI